jgi:hypothetical protein
MKYGWEIEQCQRPYIRIVCYNNSQINLPATLRGMLPGQAFTVHVKRKTDKGRLYAVAYNAGVRVKLIYYTLPSVVLVTSLGFRNDLGRNLRRKTIVLPAHRNRCFRDWIQTRTPAQALATQTIDIFS